jgi:hypothetical protein
MFRIISGRFAPAVLKTGKVSHETKTGRLAKLFRTEVLGQGNSFDFAAFGSHLMGKTVTAMSLAQEAAFDDLEPVEDKNMRIVFTPFVLETSAKNNANLPSVRLLIEPAVRMLTEDSIQSAIRVRATTIPDRLGKHLHDLYLSNTNSFLLRCIGAQQISLAIQAMAIFNEKVNSHKVQSFITTESVTDNFGPTTEKLRAVLFHVDVVPSESVRKFES